MALSSDPKNQSAPRPAKVECTDTSKSPLASWRSCAVRRQTVGRSEFVKEESVGGHSSEIRRCVALACGGLAAPSPTHTKTTHSEKKAFTSRTQRLLLQNTSDTQFGAKAATSALAPVFGVRVYRQALLRSFLRGLLCAAEDRLATLGESGLRGFWIHVHVHQTRERRLEKPKTGGPVADRTPPQLSPPTSALSACCCEDVLPSTNPRPLREVYGHLAPGKHIGPRRHESSCAISVAAGAFTSL